MEKKQNETETEMKNEKKVNQPEKINVLEKKMSKECNRPLSFLRESLSTDQCLSRL